MQLTSLCGPHYSADGGVVQVKGLCDLLETLAARGVGLGDGAVALWLGYKMRQRLGIGAALDAGDFDGVGGA